MLNLIRKAFYYVKIWHPGQHDAWLIVPLVYMIPSFMWLVVWNLYSYVSTGTLLFDFASGIVFAGLNFLVAIFLMWKYLYVAPVNTITALKGPLGITVKDYSLTEGWNILFVGYKPIPGSEYSLNLRTFSLSVAAYDGTGRAYHVRVTFSARPMNAHRLFQTGLRQALEIFSASAKAAIRKSASGYKVAMLMLSRDLVHVDRNISKVFASVGLQLTHAIVEEVTPVSKATANLIERAANSVMYARDAKSVARMMKGYIDSGLPRDIAAQLVAERQGLRTVMDSNFRISGKGARGARPFLDARH